MFKKYFIRFIGALCILAAVALMFFPNWIRTDGVKRSDLRDIRSDVDGICSAVTDDFLIQIERSEYFQDELEDYDLPYTRSRIKSRFREIGNLVKGVLDGGISMKELWDISTKAPGVIEDVNNLLESDCSDTFFYALAEYELYKGNGGLNYDIPYSANAYEALVQDALDEISVITYIVILVAVVMALIVALAVISAVTHMCNKGRWLKYLFLVILIVLVAGTCVAISLTPDMLADAMAETPGFEELTLKITATPFLAVVMMFVPVILDIIFERKKKKILVED